MEMIDNHFNMYPFILYRTAHLNNFDNVPSENYDSPDCHLYESVAVMNRSKVDREEKEEFSFSRCGAYGVTRQALTLQ